MSSPITMNLHVTPDRAEKIVKIMRVLREENPTISRSEAIGRAIDHFFLTTCPLEMTNVTQVEPAEPITQ